jgi:hypothetical protein
MTKKELENLIRKIVKEELQNHFRVKVPAMVGEVVSEVINRKLKSSKGTLKENVEVEWPTLGGKTMTAGDVRPSSNRSKLASLLGYDDHLPTKENTVSSVITDAGVEIPVDPSVIPEELKVALNRDYSSFLKKMNTVKKEDV